jgi:hypothetical protein
MNARTELLRASVEAVEPSSLTTERCEGTLVKKLLLVGSVVCGAGTIYSAMNLSQHLLIGLHQPM